MAERVAIVGGGVAGLAAAHAAARGPDRDVVVLERAAHCGGNLRSERVDGFLLEWGPHALVEDSPGLTRLIEEVGLAERVLRASPASRARFVVRGGAARELPRHPLGLLVSDVLPPAARLRVLAEPLVPRRTGDGDESVDAFARRRFGSAAAEILADALVTGIYAGDTRALSVASCFPRVSSLEREHGSVLLGAFRGRGALARGGSVSFPEGVGELPDALARSLGGRVRTSTEVTGITRDGASWRIATSNGAEVVADRLMLACPAWDAARLLQSVDPELSALLSGIPSVPIAVVHLGFLTGDLGCPPRGFGTLVPSEEGGPLLGVIAASNAFPGRAPEGRTLVTALLGGARSPEILEQSDAAIVDAALAALGRLVNPRGAPVLSRVARHERAIPQYVLGHGARLSAIDGRRRDLGNLDLIGNSYRGVSVGAAVEDGLRAV